MADTKAAWGIDIGQAGLKAIRLEYDDATAQVTATAFDYVAHPKILSQPDADPRVLIQDALDRFLSRNELNNDLVSISVPGQTALARFIQLPPVESSKVAEIVKYEARQQIPFALEDVIWDYQPLGAGTEEGGFMLDAEVGLFAMKRDQVQQHLDPYLEQLVEVETIQIAPLALYNYLCYDQLELGKEDSVDPDADYTIVLDMGADNTTLLVTNGQKIWLRNVPIGGNHFTRALTKELKLTFAKAEHLKCNATKSPDPRSVFQALRPVFNDYVSEIQRSIGFFSSVNKEAKIARIVGVGNGFKLAGLQKFLQQNLQYQVDRVHSFDAISGDSVLRAPLFQDNIMSFAVPYGLALQCLDVTRIHTSLLPPEIITERIVRKKKPWAVAGAAVLLASLAISALGYKNVLASVEKDKWAEAESSADRVNQKANKFKTEYTNEITNNETLHNTGNTLVGVEEDRIFWPEVYKAINECLPREVGDDEIQHDDPAKKKRMHVESIDIRFLDNTSEWFAEITQAQKDTMLPRDVTAGPTGPGYLFILECKHHYNNPDDPNFVNERLWIQDTFIKNLQQWTIQQDPRNAPVPVRQIGITHVVLEEAQRPIEIEPIPKDGRAEYLANQDAGGRRGSTRGMARAQARVSQAMSRRRDMRNDDDDDGGRGGRSAAGRGIGGRDIKISAPVVGAEALPEPKIKIDEEDLYWELSETKFTVQFLWRPVPIDKRVEEDPSAVKASEADGEAGSSDGATDGAPANNAAPNTNTEPTAETEER